MAAVQDRLLRLSGRARKCWHHRARSLSAEEGERATARTPAPAERKNPQHDAPMSNLDYPLRTFQTAQGVDLNSHTVGGDEDLRAYANGDTRAFAAVALAATQTVGAGRVGFVRMNAADFGRPQSGTRIIYVSQQVLEGLAALGSVGQMIRDNASKTAEAEKGTISALLCPSPDLFVSAIVLLTGIHTIGNLEPLRLPYFGRFLRMVGFNNIPRLLATAQWLQGSSDRLDNFLLVGGTRPQLTEEANAKWFATAQEAENELTKGSVLVFEPRADHYAPHLRVP